MRDLIDITAYRRGRQEAHNQKHGITPRSVVRAVQESLHVVVKGREIEQGILREDSAGFDAAALIRELEKDMADAASHLEYERAALLRDQIAELKNGTSTTGFPAVRKKATYAKATRKKRG
jgi:excinuclease ABC subunit B